MAFAVTGDYRRGKTDLFLIACGLVGAAPHWISTGKSLVPAITLAFVLGGYGLRTVLRDRLKIDTPTEISGLSREENWPHVDVLVSARDEETVIKGLVERLFQLRYPKDKLSVLIIDDGSKDQTPVLLQ